jgi:hypothetical protein
LIVSDFEDESLKLFDSENKLVDTIRHEKIKKPWSLCIDSYDNLYLCELSKTPLTTILIFDSNLKFVYEFELKKWRNPAVDSIIIDEQSSRKILLVSSRCDNKIGVWNGMNGEFLKLIDICCPYFMQFNDDNLFVISGTDFKIDKDRRLAKLNNGLNCIFILNRYSYEIVKKIRNSNWISPIGLSIIDSNIITVARYINEENVVSNHRCYLVLDINGKVKEKIELDGLNFSVNCISDLLFYEKKIIFLTQKSIKFIEI